MKKLAKYIKKISRAFTMVSTQLQNLEEAEFDPYVSEDEDEASHFQMDEINFGKSDFQFAQLDEEIEPGIASIFNQTSGHNVRIKTKLYLREVILLEIQLTMNIFCN